MRGHRARPAGAPPRVAAVALAAAVAAACAAPGHALHSAGEQRSTRPLRDSAVSSTLLVSTASD